MSPTSLLILDDNPQICRMLQAAFEARGLQTEAFQEPRYALDRLRQHPYDVVLLDVVLPNMSGIEVLTHLRALRPETKVIMMTGHADKTMAIDALRAGAFDFFEKPIDLDVLSHAVDRALAIQAMARAHQQALDDLRYNQAKLQSYANDLERLHTELCETHQAMLVLARNADRTRQDMETRLVMHLRSLIMPLVEAMRHDDRLEPYSSKLTMLDKAIEEAVSGLSLHLTVMPMLSTREMQIAMMIKNGMTTEHIALNLHLSLETVKTHRRNMRKKLGLLGTGERLQAYFQSFDDDDKTSHIP